VYTSSWIAIPALPSSLNRPAVFESRSWASIRSASGPSPFSDLVSGSVTANRAERRDAGTLGQQPYLARSVKSPTSDADPKTGLRE
jgi:hypothetical protein